MGPQQHPRQSPTMRFIHEQQELPVPEGVKVNIKSRQVTVEGPRGKLYKDLSHLAVCFSTPTKNNMIIGVTKGFKYKMRYVYAHFPINVNLDKNKETGLYEVEIRNFLGEKLVRRVTMRPGVEVVASANQKDQIELSGNDLENVSQCAADIQQICRVRNKDIRKFLDGLYVSERGNIMEQV